VPLKCSGYQESGAWRFALAAARLPSCQALPLPPCARCSRLARHGSAQLGAARHGHAAADRPPRQPSDPDGSRAAPASRQGRNVRNHPAVPESGFFGNYFSWGSNTNNEAKSVKFHMLKSDTGIFSVQKTKEKTLSVYIFIYFILRKDDLDNVASAFAVADFCIDLDR